MKHLFYLVASLFFVTLVTAQADQVTAKKRMLHPIFADTTAANTAKANKPGNLILLSSKDSFAYRTTSGKWIVINSGGGGGGSIDTTALLHKNYNITETITGVKTFSTAPSFSDIAAGRFLYTSTGGQVTQNLSLTSDGTRIIVGGASITNSGSYDMCVGALFGNGKAGYNNRLILSNTVDGGMYTYLINTAPAKWGWSTSTNDVRNNIATANMVLTSNGLQVGGTDGVTTPALLELNSTTRALLLMRMTKSQRNAISGMVAGLMIYQTDNTAGLRVYNGTNWMRYTETTD